MAKSSQNSNHHSEKLIYIRYKDHVLFQYSNPSFYMKSNIRECVGWLLEETDDAIIILWDKSAINLPNERIAHSGLAIIKSDILVMKEIDIRTEN